MLKLELIIALLLSTGRGTMTIIRAENINMQFGDSSNPVTVLEDVDLAVERGEFLAILGPSGSGKSTLLGILGCLERPTSGDLTIDGTDVGTLDENARAALRNEKIGFVFQFFNLIPALSALENVRIPLYFSREQFDDAEINERATLLLDRVGLSHRLEATVATLSGGEQQRVAIARALITQPLIVLADEPTGNLDSSSGQDIMTLMCTLQEQMDTAFVVATHDPGIAREATRVLYLADGRFTISPDVIQSKLQV